MTDDDVYLFNQGSHYRLYKKLGSHIAEREGVQGVHFAVWAPEARSVSVMGNFNGWDTGSHPLSARGSSGIWEGFIPGIGKGEVYKYHVESRLNDYKVDKYDPYSFYSEISPQTASVVWELDYEWGDDEWLESRLKRHRLRDPLSVYEVHPGSWMRKENGEQLSYRELAHQLADYVEKTGFTHVEFLPIMEHPFYGSWGYQVTGFFAPTSRYGTPQDFMYLVDYLHQRGIGVILDWVPSHFPSDEHGLGYFDGSHLYEHADPRLGYHPDWKSYIFNYDRNEVRSFLASSAMFWLDKYHVDGLRIDAVASLLYLDYSREEGEWIPNRYGGNENLGAISFLRWLNEIVYENHPDVQTIAEESTSWPMVSRPTYVGGLGFGLKWDMGWMHDTLKYMSHDPIHRNYHHNELSFRMLYAFNENFVLPLSHDEVVHGKASLLAKMPGDLWQKFANLRLLFCYMYGQAGKKLLFMGGEIGQWKEWDHESSIEWEMLGYESHRGVQNLMADLNRLYRKEPALHVLDCDPQGFEWIDANDSANSVLTFLRKSDKKGELVIMAFNCTPVPRQSYRIGVPAPGFYKEILNSDSDYYGGSGMGNMGGVHSEAVPYHGRSCSINAALPPLAAVFFKAEE
ncbi:MAG: 1,4-alpha-glucan branching protein GlgB [bacterium]